MKHLLLPLILIGLLLGGTLPTANGSDGNKGTNRKQMTIKIGPKVFTATLAENATATAFKARLPLTVNMDDLNDNEKVIRLPDNLPTDDSNPGRIQAGDLMIWSSSSLVLFYKSFPTTYSYTKLGHIHDAAGLSAAVGPGNVKVTFELKADEVKPPTK